MMKKLLFTFVIFLSLIGNCFAAVTITQSYTTNNTSQAWRANSGGTYFSGRFATTAARTPVQIDMYLNKVESPTGNIHLEIWSEVSSDPGSVISNGTSNNVDVSTLPTTLDWITFTFATPPSLTDATNYWLVMVGDFTIDGTNYVSVGKNSLEALRIIRDNDLVAPFNDDLTQTINYRLYEDVEEAVAPSMQVIFIE